MSEVTSESTAIPVTHITAEHRAEALHRVNRRRGGVVGFLWEWTRSLTIALFMFLFLHVFVMEAFKIPTGSMEGTLRVGDFLLVNKVLYGAEVPFAKRRLPAIREPLHGDVVVFKYPPDPSKNFVKRLVGMPGDTLAMTNGVLSRNGIDISEEYVHHDDPRADVGADDFRWQRKHLVPTAIAALSYHPSRNNWGPIVVPTGNYFMLGDNRDNSYDSRYWGFVPDSLIRGTPLVVYYSFEPDSADRFDWLKRVRWQRIGARVH